MNAPSRERGSLQRVFVDPLFPALTVGAATGVTGLVGGGFGGLVFSQSPVLFATSSGIQWFSLGSTFWYARNVSIRAFGNGNKPDRESLLHSTFAGSVAGAVNGALRSRSNALPGAVVFGIFGMLGQGAYNRFQAHDGQVDNNVPQGRRLLDSRWIPLKRLSDEDYMAMLGEKAIKIDAEIAIIDEKIAALKTTPSIN